MPAALPLAAPFAMLSRNTAKVSSSCQSRFAMINAAEVSPGPQVTFAVLQAFARQRSGLTALDLTAYDSEVSDVDAVSLIDRLPCLRHLVLANLKMIDAVCAALARLTALTYFEAEAYAHEMYVFGPPYDDDETEEARARARTRVKMKMRTKARMRMKKWMKAMLVFTPWRGCSSCRS